MCIGRCACSVSVDLTSATLRSVPPRRSLVFPWSTFALYLMALLPCCHSLHFTRFFFSRISRSGSFRLGSARSRLNALRFVIDASLLLIDFAMLRSTALFCPISPPRPSRGTRARLKPSQLPYPVPPGIPCPFCHPPGILYFSPVRR